MLKLNSIYQGDCRELISLMPDGYNYVVITDPPYNINFKYDEHKDNLNDFDYIGLINSFEDFNSIFIQYPEETMKYIIPALGVPDEVIAWCYNSNLPKQFRLCNIYGLKVDFNAIKQPYKNPNDKRIKKLIENGSQGTRMYDWFSDIQIVKNVSKEKTSHPCPVPVKLIERLILMCTKETDVIIDPFMGSGTTAIACINAGRNYIGIEKSQKYVELANKRIEEHLLNKNTKIA